MPAQGFKKGREGVGVGEIGSKTEVHKRKVKPFLMTHLSPILPRGTVSCVFF